MAERVINQLLNFQLQIYNTFKNVFEVKTANDLYEAFNDKDKNTVKDNYTKFSNYYKKTPSLIRKNGLILTLCFLNKKSTSKQFAEPNKENSTDKNMYNFILNNYIEYMIKFGYIDTDKKDTSKLFEYLFDETKTDTRKLMNLTVISIRYFDTCSQIINAFGLEELDG